MKNLINWFRSGVFPILGLISHDLEQDISKRLYFFTIIIVSSIFSFFAVHMFIQGSYKLAILQTMVVIVTLISWAIFKKTNSTNIAGSFLLVFGATSAVLRTYLMGGIYAPSMFIWPIIPLFTAAAMSLGFASFWTSVYISIALFFHFANLQGIQFESKVSTQSMDSIRIVAIVSVQLLVLIVINYIRSVNKKYREIIERQNDEKTNLVRILSHDIATPITIITTSLNKLETTLGSEYKDSPQIRRMNQSLKAMKNILEHVREMEAVSSGKKEMTIEPVNVQDIFNELKDLHQTSLEQKHIKINIVSNQLGGSFLVRADKKGLCYQVLNNLITNAIKFTEPEGTITITLESTPEFTKCSIKDSGIGMPQEILQNLFHTSIKTTRPGTNGEHGTGFGMPIVKNYIEKFNGKIEVQSIMKETSSTDHGTTVVVTLPTAA